MYIYISMFSPHQLPPGDVSRSAAATVNAQGRRAEGRGEGGGREPRWLGVNGKMQRAGVHCGARAIITDRTTSGGDRSPSSQIPHVGGRPCFPWWFTLYFYSGD